MGADLFRTKATGGTLDAAFAAARERARHEDGHGGYTGTVAEKHDVVEVAVPSDVEPATFAAMVYAALDFLDGWQEARDAWQDLPADVVAAVKWAALTGYSKWGPAIAIKIAPSQWVMMGWASS